MGVFNCSLFCCTLLYVHSSITIIFMGKRELIALLNLSSWCLVMVERLFLALPRGCLWFVVVVFSDHTHLLFWGKNKHHEKIKICLRQQIPETIYISFIRPILENGNEIWDNCQQYEKMISKRSK